MASMKGKRIFVFVITPPVFFFLFFLGMAIHSPITQWVIAVIGLFAVFIIIEMAQRMRCPRCGLLVQLLGWRASNKNIFINPLLCENCGYNFSEDVSKARKKKIVTRKG
jgi:predicted RNA-binding Zn-ribbon protein involved in translation (DUF1610 family)